MKIVTFSFIISFSRSYIDYLQDKKKQIHRSDHFRLPLKSHPLWVTL